jgi:carboxyl-terminal processing protease
LAGALSKIFARSLALMLGLLLAGRSSQAASLPELLEKGIYTEETKGDLKAAVEIYRQIAEDAHADRSLVAQSQLRLGLCQLKLGNRPQAISALDRLMQDFPDQDKLLAIVEQHMPQVLDEIVGQIERNYIQEVDRSELMETAIRAIVGKLDAQGSFLRTNDLEFFGTQELSQFNDHLEQKLAGIGAMLKAESGEVIVQSPLAGSPAFEGGLKAGDRIVAINGSELPEQGALETAVKLLRGPVGTPVSVGIKRPGSDELQEIKLTRNTIRLPSVLGDRRKTDHNWEFMLEEERKLGYIRLTYLGKQSAEEMRTALEELQNRAMKGLILDLRNNPGGMLDSAVAVSDLFVDSGRIVTVKGRQGETAYDAKPEDTFRGFPIAVLVNRRTASAAEIIAACLQDNQRAVVIGERTYGQGIVRSIFQLKSGVGAMKIPVAAYYRPNGRTMNRYPEAKDSDDWGVSPDPGYAIAFSDDELKQYEKDRSLRDTLSSEATPKRGFEDAQLQKALEYLERRLAQQP